MKGEQMDLFQAKPAGEVVPFPVDREFAAVRDAARQIDRRNGKLAEKYWRSECNRLYARLQVQGFPEQTIRAQVDRFARAVRAELESMYWHGQPDRGGDAA